MNVPMPHVLTVACLFCALLAHPAEGDAQSVGSIEGIIRVDAGQQREPAMLSPYSRRRYTPPVRASNAGMAESAVIFVRAAGGFPATANAAVSILQQGRAIKRRVTVVRAGARIDFPNDDDVFHNLFSLSDPGRFNLGRYPPGDSRSLVFSEAGVIRIFCDIHSEMEGTILVLETPYFTRPAPDGRFTLANIPVGTYTVVAWDAAAGADSTEVVVDDARAFQVDFFLSR